jgi:hypothetical protein
VGEWIKEFLKNGDNINEIAYVVIGILITLFSTAILNLIKWLYKKMRGLDIDISARVKKMKVKRNYKKTIKQIERMEIPMSANFLFRKSPEKNPELKKIYRMIDEGLIETSASSKLQQFFKDNPELKLKLNELNATKLPPIQIKPPSLKK